MFSQIRQKAGAIEGIGIKVNDRDYIDVIKDIITKTGGNAEAIGKIFHDKNAFRALTTLATQYRDAGGKFTKLDELINVTADQGQMDRDFATRTSTGASKLKAQEITRQRFVDKYFGGVAEFGAAHATELQAGAYGAGLLGKGVGLVGNLLGKGGGAGGGAGVGGALSNLAATPVRVVNWPGGGFGGGSDGVGGAKGGLLGAAGKWAVGLLGGVSGAVALPAAGLIGVGYVMHKQQEGVKATEAAYNANNQVDPEAAKYLGTEYARGHKAVIRHGGMQMGDLGTLPPPQVNITIHSNVTTLDGHRGRFRHARSEGRARAAQGRGRLMAEWSDILQVGSFDGVVFDFVRATLEGGNTLDQQQFPNRAGTFIQGRARNGRRFEILGIFIEDDYPDTMNKLIAKLENGGKPVDFVDPVFGTFKASCDHFVVTHDADEAADSATIQITILEHTEGNVGTVAVKNTTPARANAVRSRVTDVLVALSAFQEATEVQNNDYVLQVEGAMNAASSIADSLEATGDDLSALDVQKQGNATLATIEVAVATGADYDSTEAYELGAAVLAMAGAVGGSDAGPHRRQAAAAGLRSRPTRICWRSRTTSTATARAPTRCWRSTASRTLAHHGRLEDLRLCRLTSSARAACSPTTPCRSSSTARPIRDGPRSTSTATS
jgi:hypothetical protein